jgi:hypothetical protein
MKQRHPSLTRQRAAKSLGVADIEPLLALTAALPIENRQSKIQNPRVHIARLYVSVAGGQQLTVNASFTPTVTPTRDLWQFIAEALQAALSERTRSARSAPR